MLRVALALRGDLTVPYGSIVKARVTGCNRYQRTNLLANTQAVTDCAEGLLPLSSELESLPTAFGARWSEDLVQNQGIGNFKALWAIASRNEESLLQGLQTVGPEAQDRAQDHQARPAICVIGVAQWLWRPTVSLE